jgi:hypothetical protein
MVTKSSTKAPSRAPAIGDTQHFVLSKGFQPVGAYTALVGDGNTLRLFAEMTADPDRPEVRPQEGYLALLSSLQPGWTVRFLQIFWPDPRPRERFLEQIQGWKGLALAHPEMQNLQQELLVYTQSAPLPFLRRTILEFVLPQGDEGSAWWEGMMGLLTTFGLHLELLGADEIQALVRWMFNPVIE